MPTLLFLSQAAAQQQSDPFKQMLITCVLMGLMVYFMMIRPHRRQQREHTERMSKLGSGDKVITSSGIHGLITNIKARTVILKIADNVRIEIEKSSVTTVVTKADQAEEPEVVAQSGSEKA